MLERAHPPACVGLAAGSAPDPGTPEAPLLHGLTIQVELKAMTRTVRRLASATGISTRGSRFTGARVIALLEAAVLEDPLRLHTLARALECPAGALLVVGRCAAIPLLHQCATQLRDRIPPGWRSGYCPVCGAWPILTESRGLEQARRLRCGRCASDWAGEWLCCSFCGERDHVRLGSLVARPEGARARVDTCRGCLRYVKTLTTLGPLAAAELLLFDLEWVELDLAARAAGFIQPAGLGFPLAIELVPR